MSNKKLVKLLSMAFFNEGFIEVGNTLDVNDFTYNVKSITYNDKDAKYYITLTRNAMEETIPEIPAPKKSITSFLKKKQAVEPEKSLKPPIITDPIVPIDLKFYTLVVPEDQVLAAIYTIDVEDAVKEDEELDKTIPEPDVLCFYCYILNDWVEIGKDYSFYGEIYNIKSLKYVDDKIRIRSIRKTYMEDNSNEEPMRKFDTYYDFYLDPADVDCILHDGLFQK